MAAPGAPDSPQVYHLTESKRFGAPLAAELVHIPTFARHPHRLEGRPPLSMFATRGAWYNLGYFLDSVRRSHLPSTAAWQLSAATWHDGLFSMVAACALARRGDVGS